MTAGNSENRLVSIAKQLLARSKSGIVHWQTVDGEPANYYVHFGDETSFGVCLQSSEVDPTLATVFIKVRSKYPIRLRAKEGQPHYELFKEVFDEAHRAATRWDRALDFIQFRLESGDQIGDPPGNIPV